MKMIAPLLSFFKHLLPAGLLMPAFFVMMGDVVAAPATPAASKTTAPNIVVIMGDDVGWFNIGALCTRQNEVTR